MMTLLDTIHETFTGELAGHIAGRLGESKNGISKALDGLLPTVLVGLIHQAGSGEPAGVFQFCRQAARNAPSNLGSVTSLLGILGNGIATGCMAKADELLAALYGTSSCLLAAPVGEYAHIKPASAWALLGLVGEVLPALAGQHIEQQQLSAGGFAGVLRGLKSALRSIQPKELLDVVGLLAVGERGNAAGEAITERPSHGGAPVGFTTNIRRTLATLAGLVMFAFGYLEVAPVRVESVRGAAAGRRMSVVTVLAAAKAAGSMALSLVAG